MEHQKDNQMVYIKDLLFAVLYHWKTVLLTALALALLLAGAGFLLGDKSMSREDTQKLEIYETQKLAMDQRIASLQKNILERQTYLDNALVMALDPYHHYEAQLTVSVRLPESGPGFASAFSSQAVLEAYRSVLTEETLLTQLAQLLNQPAQYVYPLIGSTVPAIGTDTVTFTIKCNDSAAATAVAEAVKLHLEQYQAQIAASLSPHDLSVLKSTAFATADAGLDELQRGEFARLSEMLNALSDARNKRNTLVSPEIPDSNSTAKTVLILGILGAFGGVFLAVCLLWIGHIGSDKVYSCRTLTNRTGIKVLSGMDSGRKRRKLQQRLRRLEGRNPSADPKVAAADIRFRTDAQTLLVAGSGTEASRQALAQALRQAMPQAQILEAGSLVESPEALEALASTQAVVLVETCGSSRYQGILQQTEKIEDYGKQLIGCVLVDG